MILPLLETDEARALRVRLEKGLVKIHDREEMNGIEGLDPRGDLVLAQWEQGWLALLDEYKAACAHASMKQEGLF